MSAQERSRGGRPTQKQLQGKHPWLEERIVLEEGMLWLAGALQHKYGPRLGCAKCEPDLMPQGFNKDVAGGAGTERRYRRWKCKKCTVSIGNLEFIGGALRSLGVGEWREVVDEVREHPQTQEFRYRYDIWYTQGSAGVPRKRRRVGEVAGDSSDEPSTKRTRLQGSSLLNRKALFRRPADESEEVLANLEVQVLAQVTKAIRECFGAVRQQEVRFEAPMDKEECFASTLLALGSSPVGGSESSSTERSESISTPRGLVESGEIHPERIPDSQPPLVWQGGKALSRTEIEELRGFQQEWQDSESRDGVAKKTIRTRVRKEVKEAELWGAFEGWLKEGMRERVM